MQIQSLTSVFQILYTCTRQDDISIVYKIISLHSIVNKMRGSDFALFFKYNLHPFRNPN